MIIPNKIQVGAHTYDIIREDNDSDLCADFGACYSRKLKIYIDDRIPQTQQEETLIHESLHALCALNRLFPNTDAGREDEEKVVQSLGHGVYQLFKDNDLLK